MKINTNYVGSLWRQQMTKMNWAGYTKGSFKSIIKVQRIIKHLNRRTSMVTNKNNINVVSTLKKH